MVTSYERSSMPNRVSKNIIVTVQYSLHFWQQKSQIKLWINNSHWKTNHNKIGV